MQLSVRDHRPDDDVELEAMLRAHCAIDPDYPQPLFRDAPLVVWAAAHTDVLRLVAHKGPLLVGHAGACSVPDSSPTARIWCEHLGLPADALAEVTRAVVHPEHRRRGIGDTVTTHVVRRLRDRGLVPVATAREDRDASLAMMDAHGWSVIGRRTGPVSGDPILVLVPPPHLVAAARSTHPPDRPDGPR